MQFNCLNLYARSFQKYNKTIIKIHDNHTQNARFDLLWSWTKDYKFSNTRGKLNQNMPLVLRRNHNKVLFSSFNAFTSILSNSFYQSTFQKNAKPGSRIKSLIQTKGWICMNSNMKVFQCRLLMQIFWNTGPQ